MTVGEIAGPLPVLSRGEYFSGFPFFEQTVVWFTMWCCQSVSGYQMAKSVCLFGWWADIRSLQTNQQCKENILQENDRSNA